MTSAHNPARLAPASVPAATIGRSSLLGAVVVEGGVTFSLFSLELRGTRAILMPKDVTYLGNPG